jgi:hypothetical protein
VREEITNSWIFGLELSTLLPLVHLFEDVSLTSFDDISTIFSSLHLHWPSDGFVVNFDCIKTSTS